MSSTRDLTMQSHRHIHEPPVLSETHPPPPPKAPAAQAPPVLQYRMAARETAVPNAPAQAAARSEPLKGAALASHQSRAAAKTISNDGKACQPASPQSRVGGSTAKASPQSRAVQ